MKQYQKAGDHAHQVQIGGDAQGAAFEKRDRILGWALRVLTHSTVFVLGLLAASVIWGG